MFRTRPSMLAATLAALALASAAHAQCQPSWQLAPSGSAPTDVSSGIVYAAATFDPDGAGPLPARAIIGGTFVSAGGVLCNHIAQWDGTMWAPLGTGMSGNVYALAVHNGQLIAAGDFATAGGVLCNFIARWNGSTWQTLSTGGIAGTNGPIFALANVQGTLFAGGSFAAAGSQSASRIARWTTSWTNAGAGVNSTVNALVADGSTVVVGGAFTTAGGAPASRIAAFDGNFWSTFGDGISAPVLSLAKFNNQIYAGGNFAFANGQATTVFGFTRWNGSAWQALGTNGVGIISTHVAPRINAMNVFNNTLYVAGLFDFAGGIKCAGIAKFDGTTFEKVGAGTDGVGPAQADIFALTQHQNSLLVAGAFNLAGGAASSPVARWNGNEWSQLQSQPNGPVAAMCIVNGGLVAAGAFDFQTAPGTIAKNLVGYSADGGVGPFQNLGGFTGTNGPILASTPLNAVNPALPQTTIIAGSFTSANGLTVSNIARLNQFSEPIALGVGLNNTVRTVRIFGNTIYAGGDFTASGSTDALHIARFTGGAWQPLGSGITGGTPLAMAVYNGSLYIGGDFTTAGGLDTGGLARWDGTNWNIVGGHFAGAVRALTVHNNLLIIGGSFPGTGGSANIATWNGSSFSPMDTGLGTPGNGDITALAVHNSDLYAAGSFSVPGAPVLVDLAKWTGANWQHVDTTITGGIGILALQSFNGDLWAGGSFTGAGGHFIPNIARLNCLCYANCDGSTVAPVLTANDFQCFLDQFVAGRAYADCDGVGGLTANDFQCFLDKFAAGCN